ncbi:MAG TPA: hypothetical protein VG944_13645, partial [Fimbriimonas sp.]|nr:hypothetical protein [Fimbriimonas sp.]
MSHPIRSILVGALALVATAALQTTAFCQTELPDNYKWLEDVHGKRAMDWVNEHNAASAQILESDPRFAKLQAEALKVAESPDRLPMPDIHGNTIYNFWQDASHVRGILRRTTVSDYLTKKPHWKTILDIDALGKKDHKSWVSSGNVALEPENRLTLVGLSEGGEDALTYREFDLKSGNFVKNGFVIPKSKMTVSWLDKDHLLVAKDWGRGTMTTSGYPYVVKIWTRGTALNSAREVYRGAKTDVGVNPSVMHDGQGHRLALISRGRTFF